MAEKKNPSRAEQAVSEVKKNSGSTKKQRLAPASRHP